MERFESHTSAESLVQTCTAAGFYWVDLYIGTEYETVQTSPDIVWEEWLSKLVFLYE